MDLGILLYIEPKSETSKGLVRVLGVYSDQEKQNAEYDRLKAQYPEHLHLVFTEYLKLDAPARMPV